MFQKFSPANAPPPLYEKARKNYLVCDLRQKSVLTLLVSRHLILFERQVSFFEFFKSFSILNLFFFFSYFILNFHVFDNNYDVVSPSPDFLDPSPFDLRAILKRSEKRKKKNNVIRFVSFFKQKTRWIFFNFSFEIVDTRNSHGVWCMLFPFKYIVPSLFLNYYIWQRNTPSLPLYLLLSSSLFFFFQLKIKCPCKLLRNED